MSVAAIPFGKLLKIVVIGDTGNARTRELVEVIKAEHYEVEFTDSYDRDVDEDAAVGAYVISVDGERLDSARKLVTAIRDTGNATPNCCVTRQWQQ